MARQNLFFCLYDIYLVCLNITFNDRMQNLENLLQLNPTHLAAGEYQVPCNYKLNSIWNIWCYMQHFDRSIPENTRIPTITKSLKALDTKTKSQGILKSKINIIVDIKWAVWLTKMY